MRSFTSIVLLGSSLASSIALAACATNDDATSDDSAESAVDSADSASAEGDMMMAATDGSNSAAVALSASVVAGNIAANISARFQPSSCVTVTQTDLAIKAVYVDCSGVRGLVHVSGELDLAISVSLQGAITVHGTSSNLKVNGAQLTVDATATYATQGSSHTLTVVTEGSGTGPRGRSVEHDGNYTVTWNSDSQCRTITGSWSTELGSHTRTNQVDLSRCANSCPTGSVTHTFLGGKSLVIDFDGTATASWTLSASAGGASAGSSGTVTLACQ
jgi:hypothetical protein